MVVGVVEGERQVMSRMETKVPINELSKYESMIYPGMWDGPGPSVRMEEIDR